MKGTLTKISDNKNKLRTKSVTGTFTDLPIKGESFRIVGESLSEEGDFRMVSTSLVQDVEVTLDGIIFTTLNSTYDLELLPE